MTRDEILDEYETTWHEAMMRGDAQGRAPLTDMGAIKGGHCAWTRWRGDGWLVEGIALAWRCPECGEEAVKLNRVMIHLNDAHNWTWDMFANKFRDALAEGERLAQQQRS
jgi:hypothetical protein